MVANSRKSKPNITSFQQQYMLHVEAIAESEIHIGSSEKLVRLGPRIAISQKRLRQSWRTKSAFVCLH